MVLQFIYINDRGNEKMPAKVSPHQHWPQPGKACVVEMGTDNLKLLMVEQGDPNAQKTIKQTNHPKGLVVVDPAFNSNPPDRIMDWQLVMSPGPEHILGPGWADGVVVLFPD